ncbi:hypothetical protein PENTCL1PPCAC_15371 [Pristionchus entomophagus]|uniref:Dehydrogenase n=1 Tax=Pristionchus entomophagus TaxID=358040 RepID=A0AAV5TCB3_9BILA|nr:hypothetical protein PENTCL1PPCAC_15371 [Pristionchus entomophagus]
MTSVLVTGANRGIGFGLTRHLLADPSVAIVIATARNVDTATDLKALSSPNLHIIQLDAASEDSIANAAKKVAEIVGENGLDFLINNAGVAYTMKLNEPIAMAKLNEQLQVNAIAPLIIANKFYPLLKKTAAMKGSAQIAIISSTGGSIETAPMVPKDLQLYTGYFMSKAAVNMLTRRISIEWKEDHIRATCFCPGWVQTDMGSQRAQLTVDDSTIPLIKLILSLTEDHNGKYYRYNGETIPW